MRTRVMRNRALMVVAAALPIALLGATSQALIEPSAGGIRGSDHHRLHNRRDRDRRCREFIVARWLRGEAVPPKRRGRC
jgi:hypothetical protein